MKLKHRPLRLEKVLPRPAPPQPPEVVVDWGCLTAALLAGPGGDSLDAPSRRALADLRPYREVVCSFCESMGEQRRQP